MRKVDDGEKKKEKKEKKRMLFLVALRHCQQSTARTPNADRWNATRLYQNDDCSYTERLDTYIVDIYTKIILDIQQGGKINPTWTGPYSDSNGLADACLFLFTLWF